MKQTLLRSPSPRQPAAAAGTRCFRRRSNTVLQERPPSNQRPSRASSATGRSPSNERLARKTSGRCTLYLGTQTPYPTNYTSMSNLSSSPVSTGLTHGRHLQITSSHYQPAQSTKKDGGKATYSPRGREHTLSPPVAQPVATAITWPGALLYQPCFQRLHNPHNRSNILTPQGPVSEARRQGPWI